MNPDDLDDPPKKPPVNLRKVNLVIGTPAKSYGPPQYMQSLMHLFSKAPAVLGGVAHMGNAGRTCPEARGHIVHNFLAENFGTHLLFVDSDIEFQPETVFEMLALDLPIVTCGYAGRDSITPGPYAFNVELLSTGEPQEKPTNGCIRISASGLGFTLMKREALLEMSNAYAERLLYDEIHPVHNNLVSRVGLFHEELLDSARYGREGMHQWFGEDFIFFYRWRELGPGHDVWLYLNAPLVHHVVQPRGFNAQNHLKDIFAWERACKNTAPPTRSWHPEIEGWSTDILPFYRLRARALPEDAKCVEVGSYKGRSLLFLATELARYGKGKSKLWGVDPGVDWPDDSTQGIETFNHTGAGVELKANLEKVRAELGTVEVEIIEKTGLDAVSAFEDESLDLVFLDDDHTKAMVWREIKAWWPKVKVGGILSGHDFQPAFMGVVGAVNDKFSMDPTLRIEGSVWMVTKQKAADG